MQSLRLRFIHVQPHGHKPSLLALSVALSMAAFIPSPTLAATETAASEQQQTAADTRQYTIPGGSLDAVLNRFALEAGLELSVSSELTTGKTSAGLNGRYSISSGLRVILSGSGLEARFTDEQTITLVRSSVSQSNESVILDTMSVVSKRDDRISSGATKLPLDIKETPQSISVIGQAEIEDYGFTGSNDVLWLGTGINIDQYETNRATFNSRGYEIQLTQIDGLGMTNSWGTVVGQQDTFLFEKIELIRGANGLLTGVGNSSGTINYVRKRPTNEDGGEIQASLGSYSHKRIAGDYNKVFSDDGGWAGRLVVTHADKNSHLRDLHDKKTTIYGVVDGQVGDNGIITTGLTYRNDKQDSPMWGSLTLYYGDGSMADFDQSASTSQDWTYWNTKSLDSFVEYSHFLSSSWEAKVTYNHRQAEEDTRLLYAYSTVGYLNDDNTGLIGWPYSSHTKTSNDLFDANISGDFEAFGNEHNLITGISFSTQKTDTEVFNYDTATYQGLPLPAFPYGSDVYPEPEWDPREPSSEGEQKLARFYVASRLGLRDDLKLIAGANAFRLERDGSSRYGSIVTQTDYPATEEVSPYLGITYDFTQEVLGYLSYSTIFQNQDQTDFDGNYLDPMKGVNKEAGVKAEWLDGKLLTTMAIFSAEQQGLATYAGLTSSSQFYYVPMDVTSKGYEIEVTGRVNDHSRLVIGLTQLKLTGPDGEDIYEWVPRRTFNARYDTRLASMPELNMGIAGRWQSDVVGANARQGGYFLANAFASYTISDNATVRLNINNLFNKKYARGLAYGAIYGAPVNGLLTLEYKL